MAQAVVQTQTQMQTQKQTQAQAPSLQSNSVGRSGFRKAFKKWKDKLRDKTPTPTPSAAPSRAASEPPVAPPQPPASAPPAKPTSTTLVKVRPPSSQPKPTSTAIVRVSPSPSHNAVAPFFQPTTQTTIHSPADPRNRSKSPPPSSLNGASHALSRRISAPADYFSGNRAQASSMNIGTTTLITSPSMHKRRSSRLRLSFAKRNSAAVHPVQPVQPIKPVTTPPSTAPTPISPSPSAPNPIGHEPQKNTYQYTTAADIAARIQTVEEELMDAKHVIKRDQPKDWLDPGWREREEKERERVLEEKERLEKEENEKIGDAVLLSPKLGDQGDGGTTGVLKKWEWGK